MHPYYHRLLRDLPKWSRAPAVSWRDPSQSYEGRGHTPTALHCERKRLSRVKRVSQETHPYGCVYWRAQTVIKEDAVSPYGGSVPGGHGADGATASSSLFTSPDHITRARKAFS
eukprot:1540902-Pyramimonas_sp.AAC.1